MTRGFRFEGLEIWQRAIDLGDKLFDISDFLENRKLFRFAGQLRGAGMSISNNTAEGSGSTPKKGFHQFLNYARRSCYECANIIIVLQRRDYVSVETKQQIFNDLDELSRKISNFQKSLLPTLS
ncbi:four helix bundle protein [Fibrella forsythiae]|uniref:Four helix bundle protein n=1 Tax=Fibrella forsythiae TaxID=2817061 RepID=A0ABS3JK80_9BACT|nr:four helix bundle protein [Fibrella forsythiae]MBO0950408.1 four helix bundle protein [Fibrella forsythiae]